MKKGLMVIGAVVAGGLVLVLIFILVITVTSQKLVCKSSIGNATIMYQENQLTGYTVTGQITLDFDGATEYANQIGVEKYLDEFVEWFETETDGSCER